MRQGIVSPFFPIKYLLLGISTEPYFLCTDVLRFLPEFWILYSFWCQYFLYCSSYQPMIWFTDWLEVDFGLMPTWLEHLTAWWCQDIIWHHTPWPLILFLLLREGWLGCRLTQVACVNLIPNVSLIFPYADVVVFFSRLQNQPYESYSLSVSNSPTQILCRKRCTYAIHTWTSRLTWVPHIH